MKLTVPPLEIDPNEGFTQKNDLFQHKEFGERLMNLVVNTDDELVVALDAPWGEGKTTFIKMWQGLLRQNEIRSIYFDAFANDYQKDAFLAISAEIYSLIEDKGTKQKAEFQKKVSAVVKTVERAGLRIGVKAATAGLVDGTVLDDLKLDKDLEKEASELIDSYVKQRLEGAKEDKQNFQSFKTTLSKIAKNSEGEQNSPLVFIIDELDRCKPPFALEILENIKHLYSIPGVVFVLVMNRQQLEESVKCEYGSGIDASKYLQKFINIWLSFTKAAKWRREHVLERFLKNSLDDLGFTNNSSWHTWIERLCKKLISLYKLSLRDIERILGNCLIIMNTSGKNPESGFALVSVYISIVKVVFPDVYLELSNSRLDYKDFADATKLKNLKSDDRYINFLKYALRFSLATEEEAQKLKMNLDDDIESAIDNIIFHSGTDFLANICYILDTFSDK
ncbi:MAG: hypothetical protein F6J87_26415 [Spirulina sp. SIO3F2]|nr:hypothetical protein [Spirulina sp. SIO3F2]